MSSTSHGHPEDPAHDALIYAADQGRRAPSVHNTQPWTFVLVDDRLEVRADRSRRLVVLDPDGRELTMSVGAALFQVRVAVAARHLVADVDRLPDPADPDLLAVVRAVGGSPDPGLARLDQVVARRHTNRRPFEPATVPDEDLARLAQVVAAEGAVLVPVRSRADRELVAELTREADRLQSADPAYLEELAAWTGRPPALGDGITAAAVPRASGRRTDELPLRTFDLRGTGGLPARTGSGPDQTLVLLASGGDDPPDWLRCGEALERLWLELTRDDWVAGPLTQALEVPATRQRMRRLTQPAHPQMLLRVGRAPAADPSGRRPRREVVRGAIPPAPAGAGPAPTPPPPQHPGPEGQRPVSDGRGGTTWI
jgi:nitroreductase